jgi:hypothetical protein
MSRKQRAQKGQSLVELCLVVPVLLLLFMGVYTAGTFISDMNVAGQATRAGSRLGAEVGNYGYGTPFALTAACMGATTDDPCAVDQDIATAVATIAKGMQNVKSMDEIDIYDPCFSGGGCPNTAAVCSDAANINGGYQVGDPVDVYKLVAGTWTLQGVAGYRLDDRLQKHPNERAIGVRLVFHFQASAPITFFNVQASQYATMCLAPTESGA